MIEALYAPSVKIEGFGMFKRPLDPRDAMINGINQ